MENKEIQLSFAAIDPTIDKLIVSPRETKSSREWVQWGDKGRYPFYIKGLCREVPTLRSVVLGFLDYVCGDDVIATRGLRDGLAFDRKGTTAAQIVRQTAKSIAELGGFAWKITRNNDRTIGELEVLPMERVRMNDECDVFFYSEKWDKGTLSDYVSYPKFIPSAINITESVLYVKMWGDGVYPEPVYAASVKACETERSIADFHLGNIERGFMGSYLVNINSGGMVSDEMKKEVERDFTEKFAGHRNAGRIMFAWNVDREHQATLQKMEVADYGEKYATLSKYCQQQIFTAFRANPNLFGCASEGQTGFNTEEYESSFLLFNRTMVKPCQRVIIDAFNTIFGESGVVTIKPFTLQGGDTTVN